jgi:hypothetical protein
LFEASYWVEHLHMEDREQVLEFRLRATPEERSRDIEMAADGRVVWLRDIASVVVEDESRAGSARS